MQLADAEVDERDAVLLLGWNTWGSVLLHSGEARDPAAAPKLPEPIDGLWLASLSKATRVFVWVPHRGWFEGRSRPKDLRFGPLHAFRDLRPHDDGLRLSTCQYRCRWAP